MKHKKLVLTETEKKEIKTNIDKVKMTLQYKMFNDVNCDEKIYFEKCKEKKRLVKKLKKEKKTYAEIRKVLIETNLINFRK